MDSKTNPDITITLQPHTSETVVVHNPILGNETIMSNTLLENWYANTVTYYDDYAALESIGGHGLSADLDPEPEIPAVENNEDYPYVRARQKSNAVKGLPTITRTRLLNTNYWITNVVLYDEDGRAIQTKTNNPWLQLTEWTTIQYGFAGQINQTVNRQTLAESNQTTVLHTLHEYDDIGRVNTIKKKHSHSSINGVALSAEKIIAELKHDALGQVKMKNIGQKSSGGPLETLKYDYNIRGWLLGVNRSFLSPSTTVTPGASNWFGFELGYDKTANSGGSAFNGSGQFNGNIQGQLWRTAGDGIQRTYHYMYDPANRLLSADYHQRNNDGSWNNTAMDFAFWTDHSGQNSITSGYDLNGNIQQFGHRGFKLGATTPAQRTIDELTYTYVPNSNRQAKVTDPIVPQPWLGDFTDLNNGGADDYTYDENGNLTRDLNKRIGNQSTPGITYNYLNLPVTVDVKTDAGIEKGGITYHYDATGRKIRKMVFEKEAHVFFNNQNHTTEITTETWYAGANVFESKTYSNPDLASLEYTQQPLFFAQEEGRIRYIKPEASQPAATHYDYMLKDHLGNVRMVLTEEVKVMQYPTATLETATIANEQLYYGNLDGAVTRPSFIDPEYPSNQKVYRLRNHQNLKRVGPYIMLKVMAGDEINIRVATQWGHTVNSNNGGNTQVYNKLMTFLSSELAAQSGGKATSALLQSPASGLGSALTSFLNSRPVEDPTRPKAYLNWILFDEQFNLVQSGSGSDPVAGISSKAAGKLENRYKFNEGTEFNTDLGLDWYETTFRGYDPQIGRFHQIDALADANPSWSTYSFVQNNPIAFIDPLGLDTFNVKNIPDGREFNTSDVLVNDAGTMVGYWNGESWAQMFSELDDVAVVGSQKSSGGGRFNNGLGNFINSAGFVGFSRGYSIGTSSWDIYKYRFANANPDVLAFRSNTFLATANNGATKAFKMSFVGNQHYSSYRVNVMKWAFLESKSLAKLRFLEKGGFALNILGSGMVATDIMVNGFNAQNSTDAAFNVIGYAGPYGMARSAAYNVVKIGLPSDTAELRRLGEASLNGHIVHPYQVMGGLSPGFQISPSIIK